MKMSGSCALHVQGRMFAVAADETSTTVISIAAGQDSFFDWCCAVNLIYRCLVSNIWTAERAAPYMSSWLKHYGLNNNYDFCKKLAEYSPFVLDEINMRYWMEPLLCCTDFGLSFVEGFGLDNLYDEVYPPFIEALEDIFRKNGVPWEAGDLFGMNDRLE